VIDIDALSRPISDDEPAGPDLEYSGVAELDRLAAGTPGTIDPSTQELVGAAEVDVEYDKIRLTNLSDEEWKNIDVWVNKTYVVHVPKIEAKQGVRTLDFQMIYNIKGENLPTDNDKFPITDVEILKGGTMYKVKVKLAY